MSVDAEKLVNSAAKGDLAAVEDIVAILSSARSEALAQAVTEGRLTQAEADAL